MPDNKALKNEMDDEITITLDLDDGTCVNCAVITILTLEEQDYIVVVPLDEKGDTNKNGDVWFYRYAEDENDPDADPILDYIESDDEYEKVADAFDEFLDNVEFEEMN